MDIKPIKDNHHRLCGTSCLITYHRDSEAYPRVDLTIFSCFPGTAFLADEESGLHCHVSWSVLLHSFGTVVAVQSRIVS